MTDKKPNILIVMADFMGALTLPTYGNGVARTPNLTRLGEESVVFENSYCNFPLCAPSRASMMSGLLPSEIGVYDNGAEFPASIPTFAHYLRQLGYRCELSGKMHFIGPDQLHGFDQRLTTDLVPADFGWMPPWRATDDTDWPGLGPMREAGVVSRTMGIDFDEEVTHNAIRRIYDFARDPEQQPFLLTVSYIEPHEPYKTTQRWWDCYQDDDIGLPATGMPAKAGQDAHSRRLYDLIGIEEDSLTEEEVVRARHGFYSMLSYVDHNVGKILTSLESAGLSDDTVVIVTADHGSMIGERGLWGILNFFEWSMRVPFMIHAPSRFEPRRVKENVSLVDLLPTILDIAADGAPASLATPVEGKSLVASASGEVSEDDRPVYAELTAEACIAPCVMVKQGDYKYIHCHEDPALLFDLANDPAELKNLADDPGHEDRVQHFQKLVAEKWNLNQLEKDVNCSHQRRIAIYETFEKGNAPVWDYAVDNDPFKTYQRSFRETWQETEERSILGKPVTPK